MRQVAYNLFDDSIVAFVNLDRDIGDRSNVQLRFGVQYHVGQGVNVVCNVVVVKTASGVEEPTTETVATIFIDLPDTDCISRTKCLITSSGHDVIESFARVWYQARIDHMHREIVQVEVETGREA